jgi:fructokinase
MKAKVWVLGDAVVDLLPESEGRLLQCLEARRLTWR